MKEYLTIIYNDPNIPVEQEKLLSLLQDICSQEAFVWMDNEQSLDSQTHFKIQCYNNKSLLSKLENYFANTEYWNKLIYVL